MSTGMQILDQALEALERCKHSGAGSLLAGAILSACRHDSYTAPALLDMSVTLDSDNRDIVWGLLCISQQPDYSNDAQRAAAQLVYEWFPALHEMSPSKHSAR